MAKRCIAMFAAGSIPTRRYDLAHAPQAARLGNRAYNV